MARTIDIAGKPVWGPFSGLGLVVALASFGLDRLHKWWMLDVYGIAERGRVRIAPFFDVIITWNHGVSYGLFQAETAVGRAGLILFALAIVVGLGLWLARSVQWALAVAIGLIIGGALGNVFDRLLHGAVADFFSFHAFGFYWYIFNVADIWIVMGVGLILIDSAFPGMFGPRGAGQVNADGDARGDDRA